MVYKLEVAGPPAADVTVPMSFYTTWSTVKTFWSHSTPQHRLRATHLGAARSRKGLAK